MYCKSLETLLPINGDPYLLAKHCMSPDLINVLHVCSIVCYLDTVALKKVFLKFCELGPLVFPFLVLISAVKTVKVLSCCKGQSPEQCLSLPVSPGTRS